jgi:hypothetical protein
MKRLRYSLEFFAVCYDPAEVAAILEALSTMQDLLGDLHDAEVLVPELQRTLGQLVEERTNAIRRLRARRKEGAERVSLDEFAAEVVRPADQRVRPGIVSVINRLRRQRRLAYRASVDLWRQLERDGFRDRLDALTRSPVEAAS